MTEREACERLVMDGHCAGVECGDCPLGVGEWDCTGLDVVTLAEMWLRLHPCEKNYYKELGDWLMRNNLKAGDKVRILRSPTLEDMEGWECDWDDRLDKYVGQVGIVDFYYGDNDMLATFPDGEEVFVPYTVLEKVERSAYGTLVDVQASLDAMGIKVLSVELNDDNHIKIEGVIG